MPIARVKNWVAGDELDAQDLNNEFNNLCDSVVIEPFVATQSVDLNGKLLILDENGDTLLDASVDNTIDITIGGADDFRFTANTFTALSGSSIVVEAGNVTVSSGDVVATAGRVLESKGTDVASATTITVPTDGNVFDITGEVTIAAFSTTQAGAQFIVRFTTLVGLNITHNATSMIAPWGRDYRVVPGEILCFLSLGTGNYTFWSMNGPKERVGVTIEANVATAPAGYLNEDGIAVSRTTYSGLYAEIGTTFGSGDGSTTFNTPKSPGRAAINQGAGQVSVSCLFSSVSVAGDTFTVASQYSLYTGRSVVLSTTGTAPGNLTAGNTYYIIRDSDTLLELATSEVNARAGTQVNISSQGTGTHTLTANAFAAHSLGAVLGEEDHLQLETEIGPHDHDLTIFTSPTSGTGTTCLGANAVLDSDPTNVDVMVNAGGGIAMPIQGPVIVKAKYIRF
jgi:microcystin-dependent protein